MYTEEDYKALGISHLSPEARAKWLEMATKIKDGEDPTGNESRVVVEAWALELARICRSMGYEAMKDYAQVKYNERTLQAEDFQEIMIAMSFIDSQQSNDRRLASLMSREPMSKASGKALKKMIRDIERFTDTHFVVR